MNTLKFKELYAQLIVYKHNVLYQLISKDIFRDIFWGVERKNTLYDTGCPTILVRSTVDHL